MFMSLILDVIVAPDKAMLPLRLVVNQGQGAIIGRNVASDLCLPCLDKAVSRKHGEIVYESNAYYLIDHSANGIYVNQSSAAIGGGGRYRLNDGDVLDMGAFSLKATLEGRASGATAAPKAITDEPQNNQEAVDLLQGVVSFAQPLLPVVEEIPYVGPANIEPEHARVNNDFGDLEDNFTPPAMTIPADWDLDPAPCAVEEPAETSHTPEQATAQVVQFASRNTKLIEALLDGMGCESISGDQITAESMRALGQSLRASVEGHLVNREQVQLAKSKLSFDKISVDRQKESDPIGDVDNLEQFMAVLVDGNNADSKTIASKLARSIEYCGEDVAEIVSGHQMVLDRFLRSLSPEAVSNALVKAQAGAKKSDFSPISLNDGFSSSSRKWAFFQRNWKKLFARTSVAIKKEYEAKFLLAHARRMGARDEAN